MNNQTTNLNLNQYLLSSITNTQVKDIKGYEGFYAITSDGRVWSYATNKFLSPFNVNDYCCVILTRDSHSRHFRVHRLVADAFIPNPNNYKLVNHKDQNKRNNNVENLEWCDYVYNNNYADLQERHANTIYSNLRDDPCNLFGNPAIRVRCVETGKCYPSQAEASRQNGLKSSVGICNVFQGRQQTCGGYHWERITEDEYQSYRTLNEGGSLQ